jgi:Cellulose binding domain
LGSGFEAEITVTNSGATAINGWTVSWTWSGNQQMTESWNSTYSQSGETVSLTNASWNATIAADGGSVSGIGFRGTCSGTNLVPTAFSVNGTRCQ